MHRLGAALSVLLTRVSGARAARALGNCEEGRVRERGGFERLGVGFLTNGLDRWSGILGSYEELDC